jgi:hypothetical protein
VTVPILELYKDNEIHSSAGRSELGRWTPDVTVTNVNIKTKLGLPSIDKETFPTRKEAEQAGLLLAKKWIDEGQPAP